jgi:phosphonate transport system substrate-binding protein
MQVLIASVLTLCAIGTPQHAPTASAPKQVPDPKPLTLTFGVYQSEKATVMYRKLTPIMDFLSDDLDSRLRRSVDVKLTIFNSYEDCIAALVKGEVDFVRLGPASYVTAKCKQPAIEMLAMEAENGEKRFKGVIIVRKDSPIHSLADLKGKKFAFGDQNSTIGRYLAQAELAQAGLHWADFAECKYLGRHDTVASAVQMGDFDAGSVHIKAFNAANTKCDLRVLASFDNVTQPWVARAGLEHAVVEALQKSLISIKDQDLLKELKISGFLPTADAEYQFVREGMKHAEEFTGQTRGS